jgi:type III pantothenate kinase
LQSFDVSTIRAVMIASVVPNLTDVIRQGLSRFTQAPVFLVGPGLKSGVNIRTDSPSELGADIVANAVGAMIRVQSPIILVDVGTATSVFSIDSHKTILGGCIAPGLKIGLDALKEATSLLPKASLTLPEQLIGKNTDDAVRSGVIYGHAMMLDGMIQAFSNQLGEHSSVIMTGGFAKILIPIMQHTVVYAEHLTLEGLYQIYLLNSVKIHREISH